MLGKIFLLYQTQVLAGRVVWLRVLVSIVLWILLLLSLSLLRVTMMHRVRLKLLAIGSLNHLWLLLMTVITQIVLKIQVPLVLPLLQLLNRRRKINLRLEKLV